MKKTTVMAALLALHSMGCTDSKDPVNHPSSSGGEAGSGGSSGAQAGTGATAGKEATSGGPSTDAGAPSIGGPESWVPQATPLISRDVPVFASGTASGSSAKAANDADPAVGWSPDKLPCWLAYDLSSVDAAKRQQVLLAWFAIRAGGYIVDPPNPFDLSPVDYSIEINAAPGGGSPPADGWKTVVNQTANVRTKLHHVFDLEGGNWVRISITKSSDPGNVYIDVDVQSAPNGASDSWLFMGDSITHLATDTHGIMNIPDLVRAKDPARWPVIIPAGIGGTNTGSALAVIEETMKAFPGRFVVLGYGTNDHMPSVGPNGEQLGFAMEPLVEKVLAAGKIPVIPHMPWAKVDGIQVDGPPINAAIDALYEKYPQIYRGPDLWKAFTDRTDLIPEGDVHPNGEGTEFWRVQWANAMVPQ
ncbi:MAG: lipolytic protein family [Polyangiaceae bacterium]|jgi:hypothetical protein|nr:lipolytic protein family [Polyangiaceae bacterium]